MNVTENLAAARVDNGGAFVVSEDDAVLHDEADATQGGPVGKRVAVQGDEVAGEARLEQADAGRRRRQEGARAQGGGREGLGARHAALDQELDLARVLAVLHAADVAAADDVDAEGPRRWP